MKAFSLAPETVVQRQFDAYNARDLDAVMATFAEDAQLFEYPSKLLAQGAAQIRERHRLRFQEPNLHATRLHQIVVGSLVIDHELLTRTFPEGPGRLELVALYEVQQGRIVRARFIFGPQTLES